MQIKIILNVALILSFSCKNSSTEKLEKQIREEPLKNETIYQQNYIETDKRISERVNLNDDIKRDCSDAHSSADEAYTYCKRAYNSDDYEEVKSYLHKAMNSFDYAISQLEECKCDDAKSSADEGYTYAKRGYNTDDFKEMKDYARKAKRSADDTMSKADDCTND